MLSAEWECGVAEWVVVVEMVNTRGIHVGKYSPTADRFRC